MARWPRSVRNGLIVGDYVRTWILTGIGLWTSLGASRARAAWGDETWGEMIWNAPTIPLVPTLGEWWFLLPAMMGLVGFGLLVVRSKSVAADLPTEAGVGTGHGVDVDPEGGVVGIRDPELGRGTKIVGGHDSDSMKRR